jgi:nitrite reductase (NADH) large subunit
MARHVDGYACEWKGVLEDPDKLSRFVSFVNAPDVQDPTVTFTERAGRKVPAADVRNKTLTATSLGMPTIRPTEDSK